MDNAQASVAKLRDAVGSAVIGKDRAVELMLCVLLARGHVLIEDLPGVGKTTLARALARSIHASFARIQCTPDLLPSDILGTSVYNQTTAEFSWRAGPVFSNILLADEINRATPRTQSALLEAMSEGRCSTDGETRALPVPFMVAATQNPKEHAGTYPLPDSQLDRFMVRMSMGYPDVDTERLILSRFGTADPVESLSPVLSLADLVHAQEVVKTVLVDESIIDYILAIVTESRNHPRIIAGVSPRGSIALSRCCQAYALIRGRSYVVPDDVKTLALPVLAHRIIERSSGDGRNGSAPGEAALSRILDKVPVPV